MHLFLWVALQASLCASIQLEHFDKPESLVAQIKDIKAKVGSRIKRVSNELGPAAIDQTKTSAMSNVSMGNWNLALQETDDVQRAIASIVRISTVSTASWSMIYQPWTFSTMASQSVGSGVVVALDPMIIATNAHVVSDADMISIEFPALSGVGFDGKVRLISWDFDVALLTVDEAKMAKTIREVDIEAQTGKTFIEALPLSKINPSCKRSAKVLAAGFSLGKATVKVSEGIISGSSKSGPNNMVCSSTAPISPGNSGGPLMFVEEEGEKLSVMGLNFASFTAGQNLNLVVPGFRVSELLQALNTTTFKAEGFPFVYPNAWYNPDGSGKTKFNEDMGHVQVRIPSGSMLTAPGNPTLRAKEKCENGIYVSHVPVESVFAGAEPPLPQTFFLEAVDGRRLDSTGVGSVPLYFPDMVSYNRMMNLVDDLLAPINVTVCTNGTTQSHRIPMAWNDNHESMIPEVHELSYGPGLEYEMFAGIAFMRLTGLHLEDLIEDGYTTLARFDLPSFQTEPALIITYVEPQSEASEVLAKGMVIEAINGKKVKTLGHLRKEMRDPSTGKKTWSVQTDQNVYFATNYTMELEKADKAIRNGESYLATAGMKRALRDYGLLGNGTKGGSDSSTGQDGTGGKSGGDNGAFGPR